MYGIIDDECRLQSRIKVCESDVNPIRIRTQSDRVRIGFGLDLSNSDWIGFHCILFGSDQAIFL